MFLDIALNILKDSIRKDLNKMIENIFEEIAEEKECNPFEMRLCLSNIGGVAVAEMYDAGSNQLGKMDGGALIEDLFKKNLKFIPEKHHKTVFDKLGGDGKDIKGMVAEMLEDESLLIRYDEDFKLVYFKVNEEGMHPIDMDYFFENMNFDEGESS